MGFQHPSQEVADVRHGDHSPQPDRPRRVVEEQELRLLRLDRRHVRRLCALRHRPGRAREPEERVVEEVVQQLPHQPRVQPPTARQKRVTRPPAVDVEGRRRVRGRRLQHRRRVSLTQRLPQHRLPRLVEEELPRPSGPPVQP